MPKAKLPNPAAADLPEIVSHEAAAARRAQTPPLARGNWALNLGGSFDVATFQDGSVLASVVDPEALTEKERAEIAGVLATVRQGMKQPATP